MFWGKVFIWELRALADHIHFIVWFHLRESAGGSWMQPSPHPLLSPSPHLKAFNSTGRRNREALGPTRLCRTLFLPGQGGKGQRLGYSAAPELGGRGHKAPGVQRTLGKAGLFDPAAGFGLAKTTHSS